MPFIVFGSGKNLYPLIGGVNQVESAKGWFETPSEQTIEIKPVKGCIILCKHPHP